jgi:hypothetical protein
VPQLSKEGFAMTTNIGSTDRLVRLIVGAVLIVLPLLGLLGQGWPVWLSVIIGLVLVGTAFVRTCPGYSLLGVSTKGKVDGGQA